MARTYWSHKEFKIYEIPFPVGESAAYFVIIYGDRHYFKSIHAAKTYLDRSEDQQPSN